MKRRPSMYMAGLGVAATVAAVGIAATTVTREAGARAGLNELSTLGVPVELDATSRERLARTGLGGRVLLVHRRGGREFLRLDGTTQGTCYSVGPASDGSRLGAIRCQPNGGFPSPDEPMLDFSLVEVTDVRAGPHYLRAEGFAADGVTQVGAADGRGAILAAAHVERNVYVLRVPPGTKRVVALDAAGVPLD